MGDVVVLGGGLIGLSTAMLLAKDGHTVTVLERDAAEPIADADEAWASWDRQGINQFRQPHYFQARMRHELDRELPEVVDEARRLGALFYNPVEHAAPLTGAVPEPGDERYVTLTARRPTMEAAFAVAASATPGVTVRRGVAVSGLETGAETAPGIPHVTGVRTEPDGVVAADLVVDATGRRSPLPRWLADVGARPIEEEAADSGFAYHGRYFRSRDGGLPEMRAALLTGYGSFAVLTLPADNDTWAVGMVALSSDAPLRRFADLDRWNAVVATLPNVRHWVDGAEPLTDGIASLHKLEDRIRGFVVDGAPVATGVLAVSDSWACTNPSIGRGATIGLLHAVALRDTVRTSALDDPCALALAFDAATRDEIEPWYRSTLDIDQTRKDVIAAELRGEAWEPADPSGEIAAAMQDAALKDPFVFRNFAGLANMLDPVDEVIGRPGVLERVIEVGANWRDAPRNGPTRDELLAVLAG